MTFLWSLFINSIWLHMFPWRCFLFFYHLKQLKKLITQKKIAPTSKLQMTNYIIGLHPFFDFLCQNESHVVFAHWVRIGRHMVDWWCFFFFQHRKQLNFLIPLKKVGPTSKIELTINFFELYQYFDFLVFAKMSKWRFRGVCL